MQLLVPITVVPLLRQWAHPAWQVSLVACTAQYWVIPLMSFPLQWTVWPLPTPWKPVSREEFSGPPSLISLCPATEVYGIFLAVGSDHLVLVSIQEQWQQPIWFWRPQEPP